MWINSDGQTARVHLMPAGVCFTVIYLTGLNYFMYIQFAHGRITVNEGAFVILYALTWTFLVVEHFHYVNIIFRFCNYVRD